MRSNAVITLLTDVAEGIAPTEHVVFANEMSLGANEFYNAAAVGLRLEKKYEVLTAEYSGQDRLKVGDVVFRINRVETKGDKTRLTCVGGGLIGGVGNQGF